MGSSPQFLAQLWRVNSTLPERVDGRSPSAVSRARLSPLPHSERAFFVRSSSVPMLMEAAGAKLLNLSDLVRRSRPVCGASSLPSSISSRRTPAPNPREEPGKESHNPTPKVLTPLNHPVVLVGVVTLPVYGDNGGSSTPLRCPSSNRACFRFSDDTSTVCCDVRDFGVPMLGEKIRVLAFNYIPFRHGGGFLEIVKWSFASSCSGGLRPCSSVASFPLSTGEKSDFEDGAKARYSILGAVESVSPVFIAPCSAGFKSNGRNLRGFLAEFTTCGCQLCNSKPPVEELVNSSAESHSYSKSVLVYFCGSASPWHPAITKLIGSIVILSGLKKKLMFIGKEESHLMFVVTERSLLHLLRVPRKRSTCVKNSIRGEGECGHYSGVVRAVYMQGMVVELDKEVWLLLTDQQLVLPHSIRIGAIIAVKNAHFVRAKFSFTEALMLGCCFKSSILVESFSPLETGCHVMSEMQSLLGNFLASLAFSARLWMLLVVSCFRRKFAGILPEKEILGSKRYSAKLMQMVRRCCQKEGLSQVYGKSCLPSWAFRMRHGVFSEICKHASSSCGYGSKPCDSELKLVVPLSIFILYCKGMWLRVLQRKGRTCRGSYKGGQKSSRQYGGGTNCQSQRRVIPSQEIGVNLLGILKISPASGRLQLSDATGSIDVLIPDLLSSWRPNSIYEVSEYNLIMVGIPQSATSHLKEHHCDTLSCKRIFDRSTLPREMQGNVIIYFHLRNAIRRDFSFHSCDFPRGEHEELNGRFHMLQVIHKFPISQKFPGDLITSKRSTAFVEAIVLPWDLLLARNDGDVNVPEAAEDLPDNGAQDSRKRQKTDRRSLAPSSATMDDPNNLASERNTLLISSKDFQTSGHIDTNSHKIPCLASVKSSNKMVQVSSGVICSTQGETKTVSGCKPSFQKILMEFENSNFFQYQGLQIGRYYIVKHHSENSSFTISNSDYASGLKILISSETRLWSLSICSSDTLLDNGSPQDAPFDKVHFSASEVLTGDEKRIPVNASDGFSSETSDICLQACRDLLGPLESDLKEIQCQFTKLASTLDEVNLSSCNGTEVPLSLSSKTPGFGSPFPDGNLVCIRGEVINAPSLESHESLVDSNLLRNSDEDITSISVHLLMGNHTVEIFGSLRKHACPVGFGKGVNATFYRVLNLGVQNRFMLTPISFIEIDSSRMVNDAYISEHANEFSTSDRVVRADLVSSGLISDLVLSSSSNLERLHCRVVDVAILVLERDGRSDYLKSQSKALTSAFDIPISAFIVEDGSSSCFCWANGERASTLLRLSEKLPETALGSTYWTMKWIKGGKNTCRSSDYHLGKILKKHGRICIKNYGSLLDSCEDLSFSIGLENVLSTLDEDILRSVILNACFGIDWTIVGHVMDTAAVRQLEKQHFLQNDMELHSFQHLWAREVHYSDPLKEARRIIEELQTGNCSRE